MSWTHNFDAGLRRGPERETRRSDVFPTRFRCAVGRCGTVDVLVVEHCAVRSTTVRVVVVVGRATRVVKKTVCNVGGNGLSLQHLESVLMRLRCVGFVRHLAFHSVA